jgi:hypothetical protein
VIPVSFFRDSLFLDNTIFFLLSKDPIDLQDTGIMAVYDMIESPRLIEINVC